MWFLLFSITGLLAVNQIEREISKVFTLSKFKKALLYILLNLISLIFLIFKEQLLLFVSFIGLILIFLICLRIYFYFFLKKVFLNSQIQVVEVIKLNILSGHSAINSCELMLNSLTQLQYKVFSTVLTQLKDQKVPIYAQNSVESMSSEFTSEIVKILRGKTHVAERLSRFKKGLVLQNNLKKKLSLALLQTRAQAMVAFFIYILLFFVSWSSLGLKKHLDVAAISFFLMLCGLFIIFKLGKSIKWTA